MLYLPCRPDRRLWEVSRLRPIHDSDWSWFWQPSMLPNRGDFWPGIFFMKRLILLFTTKQKFVLWKSIDKNKKKNLKIWFWSNNLPFLSKQSNFIYFSFLSSRSLFTHVLRSEQAVDWHQHRAFSPSVINELKFTAASDKSKMSAACQELLHAEFPTLDSDLQNYVQGKRSLHCMTHSIILKGSEKSQVGHCLVFCTADL